MSFICLKAAGLLSISSRLRIGGSAKVLLNYQHIYFCKTCWEERNNYLVWNLGGPNMPWELD